MSLINIRLQLTTDEASGKLKVVEQELNQVKSQAEEPKVVKLSAEQALGTIRDVKLALDGVIAAVKGVTAGMNALLDANLKQKQAMQLAAHEWGEGANEMSRFSTQMQKVTNFGDDDLLPLMVKLGQTYKLSQGDVQSLTMGLLDFTEANKATGMTVESAFDLMGRALNGHTEMLGRYGIELDDTRLKTEGVSYLVEKLAADYGGTAVALADLRTQNQIAWGDIQESVGGMLETVLNPVLQALKWLMDAFTSLHPAVQGFIAGLVIAVPLIATTATVITTLTAAVTALKTAINPVAGIVSLVVGAVSVLGLSIAGAVGQTNAMATAQKDISATASEARAAVEVEAEKFGILSNRLLELRRATELTNEEKNELGTIVRTLNNNYGQYLGNIDLEKARYNDLKVAIDQVSSALVNKLTMNAYENIMSTQVQRLADAKVALSRKMEELTNVRVPSTQDNFVQSAYNVIKMLEGRFTDYRTNPSYVALRTLYDQVMAETNALRSATNEYQAATTNIPVLLNAGGTGNTARPPQSDAEEEERRRSYERMREEFQTAAKSETDILNIEYTKRLAMIRRYTEENSIARALDMQGLEAWHTEELKKISSKEKELSEQSFKDQIDYYANLENLGVSSYDAMKRTMEEYYAWAKANLPAEEQKLILLQLRETNLRWGEARAKREQEEFDHQTELMGVREQFRDRQLELDNNTYQAQLTALEMYYETRRAKLLEAGMTEEEIERQKAQALHNLNLAASEQMAGGLSKVLGTLASSADQESKQGFAVWKGLAYAQAMVDMYSSASAAYKSMVGIPIAGPGLAVAAAAAAVVAGLANIRNISKTKYEKKAATGMYVDGPSHSQGGVPIEVEGGEFIVRKEKVSALGRGFFEFLNFAPLSQVRGALAGLSIPALSVPMPDYAFATGGYAGGGNTMQSLVEAVAMLSAKIEQMGRPNVITKVYVDPLTGKSVQLSELVDKGKMIRSEV